MVFVFFSGFWIYVGIEWWVYGVMFDDVMVYGKGVGKLGYYFVGGEFGVGFFFGGVVEYYDFDVDIVRIVVLFVFYYYF